MARRKKKNRVGSVMRELLGWLFYILIIIGLTYLIITYVGQRTRVSGSSMENTLSDGDNLIVDKLSYRFHDPERFDIIVFPFQFHDNTYYIKRIIGLPGETVEIRDGHIYIDGSSEPLEDVETKEYMVGNYGPYTVPEGCYFVMGDNRNDSKDSRYWINPYVSKDKILGKAVFRYWPITEMKTIK